MKEIDIMEQSEEGNASFPQYGFTVTMEAVYNGIPSFHRIVYIEDSNIPLTGDYLKISANKSVDGKDYTITGEVYSCKR